LQVPCCYRKQEP